MILKTIENKAKNIANLNLKQLKKMFSKEDDVFLKKIILLQIVKKSKLNSLSELELFCNNSQVKNILECSLK